MAGSLGTTAATGAPSGNQALAAGTNETTTAGVYDMNGKCGQLSSGSNIRTVCLALNTTSLQTIVVNWDAATQRRISAGRVNELLLQYRVGTSGPFTNVASSGYQNVTTSTINTGTGATDVTPKSVTLPSACDGQAVVQIRWIVRDVSGSGSRPSFSIDNVSVTGSVLSTPSIAVSPATLSGFSTTAGTASTSQSYSLSASNLSPASGNITVTAPASYEVSTNNSTFSGSVNVAYTGGTLAATNIFVRIAASAGAGSPSGNVTNAGGGATTQNVAVSGTVCPVPSGTFAVGDITIMGYLSDDPDGFSFVNWVSIPNGTSISFTDNGWTGTALTTNENTVVWQNNTGSAIAPGTVILLSNSSGTGTTDQGTIVSGVLSGISASDDNIFAYTGTLACPEFIFGFSNAAWISTGVPTNNQSYLPSPLNVANGNLVMPSNLDNWQFSGSRSNQSTIAAYKPIVNNATNYTGNDTPFTLSSTDFTAATPALAVSPSSLSGFTTTAGTASASQSYTLSGSDLSPASGNITVTAPTGFEVSTNNTTFSGSVNVAYSSGTLASTTIFVRIAASAGAGSPSGNVTNAGGGASTQNVAVSGSVCATGGTLAVGDISILGFLTDAPDGFSFVNWASIPAGATISFTDNAWTGTALNTGESTLVWQNTTGSAIAPGRVIVVTDAGGSTGSADLGTVTSGNLNNLSASNENIFVYQGSPACAQFIYGITNTPWITTGVPNTNNSYLPASLNVSNGNLVTTSTLDNWEYSASRSNQTSIAAYKPIVNSNLNWTGNDNVITLSSTDFTIGTVTTFPNLVINEVMYNSTGLDEEWVELYNWGTTPVVLSSGFTLENTNPAWSYTFPTVTIPAGGYLTIQVGSAGAFPFTPDLVRSSSADQLVNSTSTIRLKNNGLTFDQVTYADASPWPTTPDGNGPSLSLKHPRSDNSQASFWKASCANGGTPGAYNGVGDLYSAANGAWANNSTWAWAYDAVGSLTTPLPSGAVPTCKSNVSVRHSVTLAGAGSAEDLMVPGGSGSLTVNSGGNLTVSDDITLTYGSLILSAGSTASCADKFSNNVGTLNIGNSASFSVGDDAEISGPYMTMSAGSTMTIGDDWINLGQGFPTLTDGTVIMSGVSGTRTIGTTNFSTLRIASPAADLNPGSVINVSKALELASGILNTSAGTLTLTSTSSLTAYLDNFSTGFTGSLAGNITMQRFMGNTGHHYFGSPVGSVDIQSQLAELNPSGPNNVQVTASSNCSSDSLGMGSAYGSLFQWNEAGPFNGPGNCQQWGWYVRSSGQLQQGRGYAFYQSGPNLTMSVTGPPPTGNQVFVNSLSNSNSIGNGRHLLSNPYPSPMVWTAHPGFDGQMHIWNSNGTYGGTYSAYIPSSNFIIASSQAFFVRTGAGNQDFYSYQADRRTGNATFYKESPWFQSSIELNIKSNGYADLARIYLTETATDGWDSEFDAVKMPHNTWQPSIATEAIVPQVDSEHGLSINSMPATLNSSKEIPVIVQEGLGGTVTISIDPQEGLTAAPRVVFEDRLKNLMMPVSPGFTYAYQSEGGDSEDRFYLHLEANGPTDEEPKITLLVGDGGVWIQSLNTDHGKALFDVTDLSGRVISSQQVTLTANKAFYPIQTLTDGLYIVTLRTQSAVETVPVFIRN